MANSTIKKFWLLYCSMLCSLCFLSFCPEARATRIPKPLYKVIQSEIKTATKRLDGVIKTESGDLYVPLLPETPIKSKEVKLIDAFPKVDRILYIFNNGWAYVKLLKQEDKLVLSVPDSCPKEVKELLLKKHLPKDLIVPQGMAMTEDLKALKGELDIEMIAIIGGESNSSQSDSTGTSEARAHLGKVFLTSPQTGKILILNKKLEKISELQTDGTPSGMAISNNKLFVCDQTKCRILIIDPKTEKFSGQINLKQGSSPTGIIGLPDGKFLYVCETGKSVVSTLEVNTEKFLIKTRTRPGPTKIAITPNGYILLVVNGQSGEVTFISTLNQKALGFVKVGELPSEVIVTKNSKAAFVSNRVSNTISIIDITHRRVANTIKVGDGPTGIALSPDEKLLFVANAKDNTIIAYNTTDYTKARDVQLPLDVEFPGKILFLPGTSKLLVTSAATDTIGVLDIETMKFTEQPRIGCTSDNAICFLE